jgi:uncharacterized protein
MFVKIHSSYRNVVAICDENLIGKKFEEGGKQLDVRESFYKGDIKSFEETLEIVKKQTIEDSTFSIVGDESVKVAIEAGVVLEKDIKKVENVPFVLVLL